MHTIDKSEYNKMVTYGNLGKGRRNKNEMETFLSTTFYIALISNI